MTPLKRVRPVADTIPDNQVPDESGVSAINASMHPADRKRLENLLSGAFLGMYEDSFVSHRFNGLLPTVATIAHGHPLFPSPLSVLNSFSATELGHAAHYVDPVLLLSPPWKTRVDLVNLLQRNTGLSAVEINDKNSPSFPFADDFYRAYIADGPSEMSVFPEDRKISPYDWRRAFVRRGYTDLDRGMTSDLYALLAMQFNAKGRSLDQQTFTFLDDEDVVIDNMYRGFDVRWGADLLDGDHLASIQFYKQPLLRQKSFLAVGRSVQISPPDGPCRAFIEYVNTSKLDTFRGRFRRVLGGNPVLPS